MAKICLKSFEELIVPEKTAQAVFTMLEEHRDDPLGLAAWPVTIEHQDGLWHGNLSNIGPVSMSDKQTVREHSFKSREDLQRFHDEYGYGAFESKYEKGYGVVDVRTQFLIKTGQAKINGDTLVILNTPYKEKWNDLWGAYEEQLDPFNEL